MDKSRHFKPTDIMKMPIEHRKRYIAFRMERFLAQIEKHKIDIQADIENDYPIEWDYLDEK